MFKKIFNYYLLDFQAWQRLNIAISKGGAMMAARHVDLTQPANQRRLAGHRFIQTVS